MSFSIEVVNVFRDFAQGLYGNRIPLDDEDVLKMLSIWDELVRDSAQNANALVKFGPFEIGGAHPQVTAEFENRDFMEVYRVLRARAPHTPLRPLFRGANGFLLAPIHENDLNHLLSHMAEDLADRTGAPKNAHELLRVKIFDSQGVIDEIESSVNVVANLNRKGYLVSAESAIPYSNTKDIETQQNIYPDELYIQKVVDSYQVLKQSDIPLHLCRISLKDMVGQLDPKSIQKLLPKIIKRLQELQKDEAQVIPLGLHLHDTGLAKDAYVAAIEICESFDYPITIDTVECDPFKPEYVNENAYKNTGFTSLFDIHTTCQSKGIDLQLTPHQIDLLKKMAAINLRIAHRYAVRRVDSLLTGAEMQAMDMPGGGYASFSTAVSGVIYNKTTGLAKILQLNETDALLLAGYGLNAVSILMGYPFAVTPGFQNKQIAALHLLMNMIITKKLVPGMSIDNMKRVVLTELTDQEVETLFLTGLNKVVAEFLTGEMPAETIQKMNVPTKISIHPKVRQQFKRRTGLLTASATSHLLAAQSIATTLYDQKLIKPTATQEAAVTRALPSAHHGKREQLLRDKTIQTHITWALELGDPKKLAAAVKSPWRREPNPSHHQDKQSYHRALTKSKKGRNPVPDRLEYWYEQVKQGKLPFLTLCVYTYIAKQKECIEIYLETIDFIIANKSFALEDVTEAFYQRQEAIIQAKESKGEYFILSKKRRLDIAIDYLATQMRIGQQPARNSMHIIHNKRKAIEARTIISSTPGQVLSILIKEGDYVKSGQPIAMLFAQKMEITISAPSDGYIVKVAIKPGETLSPGQLMMEYQKAENNRDHEQQTSHDDNAQDISALQRTQEILSSHRDHFEQDLRAKQTDIETTIKKLSINVGATNGLTSDLQKRGFFGRVLSLTAAAKQNHEHEIHIIGNRAGCAIKSFADLKQANYDVRLLYVKGDQESALIKYAKEGETIWVDSYTDHRIILTMLENLAKANPNKHIYFHPGWAFLSEDDKFVAALERLGRVYKIHFVGPPSDPMRLAGGKKSLRDVIAQKYQKYNPEYFGNTLYSSDDLQQYITDGFLASNPIHAVYQQHFEDVIKMGGDVRIKAIAGGGGMGIVHYVYDHNVPKSDNYRAFMIMVQKNVAFSERTFQNGEMLTEQSINGMTRHLEFQVAVNDMGAILFGVRDCTLQIEGQKTNETNVIRGDYDQTVMLDTLKAAKEIAAALGEKGYRGVCTLEALVLPDGTVKFLEANTRLQVEHMVTEEDIYVKTGKSISLPLVNLAFSRDTGKTPAEILERDFNFTNDDLMRSLSLGVQRIEHIRLNSSCIDFQTGKADSSFFWGDMWPGSETIALICFKTGAKIIIGDIGDGQFNKQTGAICGTSKEVLEAAIMIHDAVELARTCMREEGMLTIDSVIAFQALMYNDAGNFSEHICTRTQDEFLEYLRNHPGSVEANMHYAGTTPLISVEAVKSAFNSFLKFKEAQVDSHRKNAAVL